MKEIFLRRSIRKYTGRAVPAETLQTIVKAGMYAPSAGNEQPWEFVVITEREILDKIPEFHPHAQMLFQAPAAILVCGDISREKHKDMWIQDCAAATENILLEIVSQGMGGVWLGIYPREQRVDGIRELLGLPEGIIPFSLIALGFSDERVMPQERFDAARIHHDRW